MRYFSFYEEVVLETIQFHVEEGFGSVRLLRCSYEKPGRGDRCGNNSGLSQEVNQGGLTKQADSKLQTLPPFLNTSFKPMTSFLGDVPCRTSSLNGNQ